MTGSIAFETPNNSLETETPPDRGLALENIMRTLFLTPIAINPELCH
jgi:hypothetical protein